MCSVGDKVLLLSPTKSLNPGVHLSGSFHKFTADETVTIPGISVSVVGLGPFFQVADTTFEVYGRKHHLSRLYPFVRHYWQLFEKIIYPPPEFRLVLVR